MRCCATGTLWGACAALAPVRERAQECAPSRARALDASRRSPPFDPRYYQLSCHSSCPRATRLSGQPFLRLRSAACRVVLVEDYDWRARCRVAGATDQAAQISGLLQCALLCVLASIGASFVLFFLARSASVSCRPSLWLSDRDVCRPGMGCCVCTCSPLSCAAGEPLWASQLRVCGCCAQPTVRLVVLKRVLAAIACQKSSC